MSIDKISLGRWREGEGPVEPLTPQQDAAGRAAAASIALHVAKAKLAALPKSKQLDKQIAAVEQQIDALIAGLEAIDRGGGELKAQLAHRVAELIEEQLNLTRQRVERIELEDAIAVGEIIRGQASRIAKKATE
ncbi:hypothetical protein I6F30_16200 [Bradyrhizobium sp. NBAIM20]|uniref:hypothetical protein n=1 Tax=unclassified Bradyrhizobium TaxID=2631580 RepID=UPI001CD7985C|nr:MULTISPECIES: hypothetical protein [unclassified Bradyrhizobium]MCA1412664.1 hypothetical protein [Bradyrhizobium sp. NBAIM20]MCA1463486.1 hypothetical protein [Bradyrhizobium sp. NBAIM18]